VSRRVVELERQLATGWPPPNPKAATARFLLVREYAERTGQRVQDIKKKLKRGIPLQEALPSPA
jgi:hypothetical protein